MLVHVGPNWPQVGPSWPQVGPKLAPSWPQVGPKRPLKAVFFDDFRAWAPNLLRFFLRAFVRSTRTWIASFQQDVDRQFNVFWNSSVLRGKLAVTFCEVRLNWCGVSLSSSTGPTYYFAPFRLNLCSVSLSSSIWIGVD